MENLTFNAVEKEEFGVRDFKDRRKRVNRLIVSYRSNAGNEYRKSYTFPTNFSYDMMIREIKHQLSQ